MNTEKFIEKAREVHGDRYDYSKVKYSGKDGKISILCSTHGEFIKTAGEHRYGKSKNCPQCSIESMVINKRQTKRSFIERSGEVHGDRYDYSKVDYVDRKTPVKIICPVHGEYKQAPSNHLHGNGCQQCRFDRGAETRWSGIGKQYLAKARAVHGDRYDYGHAKWTKSTDKIKITCSSHGEFEQRISHHLRGQGCPFCNRNGGYNDANRAQWENKEGLMYTLHFKSNDESFYKTGITSNLERRLREFPKSYEIVVIHTDSGKLGQCYDIEQKILSHHKKYIPKIKFGGMYECYTMDVQG